MIVQHLYYLVQLPNIPPLRTLIRKFTVDRRGVTLTVIEWGIFVAGEKLAAIPINSQRTPYHSENRTIP
jgi:hypothetical protein